MRSALLIVVSVLTIAAGVAFWPPSRAAIPFAPRRAELPSPPGPILAAPADVPVARAARLRPRAAPVAPAHDAQPSVAVAAAAGGLPALEFAPEPAPVEAALLPSRALAVQATVAQDWEAAAVMLPGARAEIPDGEGVVTRAFSAAGRQISDAFRTAGTAVRSVF